MLDETILEKIVLEVLAEFQDEVELILLFGSHATGHAHDISDIDIAVRLRAKEDYTQDVMDLLSLCNLI